jgi:hypothetical protein
MFCIRKSCQLTTLPDAETEMLRGVSFQKPAEEGRPEKCDLAEITARICVVFRYMFI